MSIIEVDIGKMKKLLKNHNGGIKEIFFKYIKDECLGDLTLRFEVVMLRTKDR